MSCGIKACILTHSAIRALQEVEEIKIRLCMLKRLIHESTHISSSWHSSSTARFPCSLIIGTAAALPIQPGASALGLPSRRWMTTNDRISQQCSIRQIVRAFVPVTLFSTYNSYRLPIVFGRFGHEAWEWPASRLADMLCHCHQTMGLPDAAKEI